MARTMARTTKSKVSPEAQERVADMILDAVEKNLVGYAGNYGKEEEATSKIAITGLRNRDSELVRACIVIGCHLSDHESVLGLVFNSGGIPIPRKITAGWIIDSMGERGVTCARFTDDGDTIRELLAAGLPDYGLLTGAIEDGFCAAIAAFLDAGVTPSHAWPLLDEEMSHIGHAAVLTHPRFALGDEKLCAAFQDASDQELDVLGHIYSETGIYRNEIIRRISTGATAAFVHITDPAIVSVREDVEFARQLFNSANVIPIRQRNRSAVASI